MGVARCLQDIVSRAEAEVEPRPLLAEEGRLPHSMRGGGGQALHLGGGGGDMRAGGSGGGGAGALFSRLSAWESACAQLMAAVGKLQAASGRRMLAMRTPGAATSSHA
eukprot:360129-Chlamydomonas_euryale.AAC.5